MEKHVTIVAVLHIAFGVIGAVIAGVIFLVIAGGGVISGDPTAFKITVLVATVIAYFLLFLSLPGIIGGFGLLNRRGWARVLVIILAVLDLFNLPLGTALGIYSLWVLLHHETDLLFRSVD